MKNARKTLTYRHWIGAFICAICLIPAGCSQVAEEEDDILIVHQPEEETGYITATVSVEDVVKSATVRCSYMQTEEEVINIPMQDRKVEERYAAVGDKVEEGQLLAVLTGGDYEKEIRELEYKIERNKLLMEYTDADETYDLSYRWWNYIYQSSMSEEEKEDLEESLESIRQSYRYKREDYQDAIELDTLRIEKLRREMEENRVYAGISGEITYWQQMTVAYLSESELTIRIADDSSCIFEASQSNYADAFYEGQVLLLELDAGNAEQSVEVIPYDMENWGEKLYFEVLDRENTDIQVGTMGNLNITSGLREQVLSVPKSAVYTAGEKYYVYVEGEYSLREVKWIEVGLVGDSRVEILGGLSEGDEIILK